MYSNTCMFNSHTCMPEICSRCTGYNHCPYAVPPHNGSSSPLSYAAKAKGLCKGSTKLSCMMPSNTVSNTACFFIQYRLFALLLHIYINKKRERERCVCGLLTNQCTCNFKVSTIYTITFSIFDSTNTKFEVSASFKAPNEQLE